jgi:hypothetical protein
MKNNKIVKEQIDYGDYPERMNPEIQKKLEKGETPFSKNRAMPEGNISYEQIAASQRFKAVVDKFLQYGGERRKISNLPPDEVLANLMSTVFNIMNSVMMTQLQNKEFLENLAIKLIKEEFDIPEGAINFEAELVLNISKNTEQLSEPEEFSEDEIEETFKGNEEELLQFQDAFEKFNLEKEKRRLINSLIQGAANKGTYLFTLADRELNSLAPDLTRKYGLMQSAMEYLYWIMPDMEALASSGEGQMGVTEPDYTTDPPTIRAKAATFPLLVHELYKGVMEMLFSHGLPDDPRQKEMVVGSSDTLPSEIWDTRLGPYFWEKFLEAHPETLFEDEKKMLRNYLVMELGRLSVDEFFKVWKSILSGSNYGKDYIQKLVNKIDDELRKAEMEKSLSDDEDDDIDLNDLLSGLNIDKPE